MRLSRFFLLILSSLLVFAERGMGQVYTVQQSFTAAAGIPEDVVPTQGRDGKLYGTFSNDESTIVGGVFQFSPAALTTFNFPEPPDECYYPTGGVTLATDGSFYGTVECGGSYGYGTLYKATADGDFTALYDFENEGDGGTPAAPPIEGSDGNFYGTTDGSFRNGGVSGATVYRYVLAEGTLTTLYQFASNQQTVAPLVQGMDGNLYGTTIGGGTNECGTIFKLTTQGVMLSTYSFTCQTASPYAPLIQASDGNFYGVTSGNCGEDCPYYGAIYRMTPSGAVSVIHNFAYKYAAIYPTAGLVEGTDGFLYGGVGRVLYRISKAGEYLELVGFPKDINYYFPAGLIQHTNGTFYGTTPFGGQYRSGTIFSLDMGLGPFLTFVRPSGGPGRNAQILGQGLTGTTSVTFNGVPASSFSVVSDTFMTAVVPGGATTGKVAVATPGGVLTSNVNFRVSE